MHDGERNDARGLDGENVIDTLPSGIHFSSSECMEGIEDESVTLVVTTLQRWVGIRGGSNAR